VAEYKEELGDLFKYILFKYSFIAEDQYISNSIFVSYFVYFLKVA
jgi:capsule polysaccharide export protein KpsE/RkpR